MNADAPTPPAPGSEPAIPPADAPVAPAPATPPAAPAKPATWPEWFPAFDVALAIFAVVLAFLMASFVARNSDLWRHLAAGRLVTQGQYQFGGDTFSFTTEGRVWVNAHWLGETALYLLFAADPSGAVVVAAKAVAFAAAFGLLFLLRKPGFPLWPWAVAVAAAVVAAGGQTNLRPQVFALPLFAGILAVLFAGNWAKGSRWKLPAVLGGLTALWANVDTFAFLSPLLIGLVLVGEWLHPRLLPATSDPPADDPFPSAPSRDALLRALMLCAAGCLLNPTFLAGLAKDPGEAVAQLVPFELDWQAAEELKVDRDLSRFTHSVFHQGTAKAGSGDAEKPGMGYMDNPAFGKNPSGITAVVLWGVGLLAGAGVVTLGVLRGMGVVGWSFGRLGWVLVWLAFTLLAAAVHARFVPYAVVAGVPLVAAALTALGRRVPPLERLSADAGRGVVMLTQLGRVLTLAAVVLVTLAALPGWLHPKSSTAGMQRFVGWGVEPDEGMKRAGEELFARWHTDPTRSTALADTRGLNAHPDLGDYLAYFAPAEKSFVTTRYRLHRAELKDLVAVRRAVLEAKGAEDRDLQVGDLLTLLKKYEEGKGYTIGYVSIAQAFVPLPALAVQYARRGLGAEAVMRPGGEPIEALWHVDGRLGVVGRLDTDRGLERAAAMKWEAAAFAFGPQQPDPAPPPPTPGRPPQEGWEYDLLFIRPPLTPIEIEDAIVYDQYATLEQQEMGERAGVLTRFWMGGTGLAGGGPLLTLATLEGPRGERLGPLPQYPRQPKEFALPFLIARSARRGLADDPNNPFGYFILARAFQQPLMPDTEPSREVFRVPVGAPLAPTEPQVQLLTALNRTAARLPEPGQPAGRHAAVSLQTRAALLQLYLRVGPPAQAYTFFLQNKQPQAVPGQVSPLGYLDSARETARQLVQVADGVSDETLSTVADQLVPLWRRAFELVEREFWLEFQTFFPNKVDPRWWQMIEQRQIFELLTQRKYLAADDDPRKWLDKFAQGLQAGQVDAGVLRQRLGRLRDVLDELVRRRADRVKQATAGQKSDVLFLAYVQSGLPETALKMVLRKEDEANQAVPIQPADVLRLLLWVGQTEEAQRLFDKEVAEGGADTPNLPPAQKALLKSKYRVIEYELAKLNGDYARADVLFDDVLATPLADLGAGQPADSMLFGDQWLAAVYLRPLSDEDKKLFAQLNDMTLPPVGDVGVLTGGGVHAWAASQREDFRLRLLFQAFTRYRRGVYALLNGNVARAKEHFDAAIAPQGVPLEQVGLPAALFPPLGQLLPKYRELLEKYGDKK